MGRCLMTGTNAMRRDLHRRAKALEGDAVVPDDAGNVIEVTPQIRALLRDNPSDAAAFKRMVEGDSRAVEDMTTPLLRLIAELDDGDAGPE